MGRVEELCSEWMGGKSEASFELTGFSYHPPMGVPGISHAEVSGSLSLSDGGRCASLSEVNVRGKGGRKTCEYVIGVLGEYGKEFHVRDFNDNKSSVALYCLGPTFTKSICFTFHCRLPEVDEE